MPDARHGHRHRRWVRPTARRDRAAQWHRGRADSTQAAAPGARRQACRRPRQAVAIVSVATVVSTSRTTRARDSRRDRSTPRRRSPPVGQAALEKAPNDRGVRPRRRRRADRRRAHQRASGRRQSFDRGTSSAADGDLLVSPPTRASVAAICSTKRLNASGCSVEDHFEDRDAPSMGKSRT